MDKESKKSPRGATKPTPEQRVLRYIRENNLITSGQKILVAVSGGADSVCLLHLLVKLQETLGVTLHVAHLDHRLRGKASRADALYVKELARRLGIPAIIEARDVKGYWQQHRLSPEEAAREVRYAFFAEAAAAVGAASVAVGHTADDNVETILMHLLRGSGTRGLRGLLPVTPLRGLTVIRPLLEMGREETAAYCRRHRLAPRLDASNLSPEPFRNRIRHELLPGLKTYNPQVAEALLRTARLAAADLEFIDAEVARARRRLTRTANGIIIIEKKEFLALPPALQRHLLRAAIEGLLGDLRDIEAGHIEDMLDALDKPAGRKITLPGGLIFTIEYDRYLLGTDAAALSPFPPLEKETELKIPGKTATPGWDIEAAIIDAGEAAGQPNGFTAFFDMDTVGDKLTVRRRRPGDRFQPQGLGQPKKLNEFMIDAKIPRAWRQRVPIVSTAGRILWVVGWRTDERARVGANTEKVLRLEFRRR